MRIKPNVLLSAIHKTIRFYESTKECAGYFTPYEILTLIEFGVKPNEYQDRVIRYALDKKKNGISNPIWFYFYPNEEFLKRKGIKC